MSGPDSNVLELYEELRKVKGRLSIWGHFGEKPTAEILKFLIGLISESETTSGDESEAQTSTESETF